MLQMLDRFLSKLRELNEGAQAKLLMAMMIIPMRAIFLVLLILFLSADTCTVSTHC